MGVSAATQISEHTLVTIQHVAGATHAALVAGGGGRWAAAPTEAFWVQAGGWTGGEAAGVEAVVWALHGCGAEEAGLAERPAHTEAAESKLG